MEKIYHQFLFASGWLGSHPLYILPSKTQLTLHLQFLSIGMAVSEGGPEAAGLEGLGPFVGTGAFVDTLFGVPGSTGVPGTISHNGRDFLEDTLDTY